LKPVLDVVAAVIRRPDGQVLIARRLEDADEGGLWEFPGGKREASESRFHALRRELNEELDITVARAFPLLRLRHEYPSKTVDLDIWEVPQWHGNERGREGQRIKWVLPQDLESYDFPAANKTIIDAARLPRALLPIPVFANRGDFPLAKIHSWLSSGVGCICWLPTDGAANLSDFITAEIGAMCRCFATEFVDIGPADRELNGGPRFPDLRPHVHRDVLIAAFEESKSAAQNSRNVILTGFRKSAPKGLSAMELSWRERAAVVERTAVPVYAVGGLRPTDLARAIGIGCQGIVLDDNYWFADPEIIRASLRQSHEATGVSED
jgi:8-oxo-dGTP diphosphatase